MMRSASGPAAAASPSHRRPFGSSACTRRSNAPVRGYLRVRANLLNKLFGGGDKQQQQQQQAPQQKGPGAEGQGQQATAKRAAPEVFLMSQNPANPEFPPYSVIKRGPKYDLRLYEVYPVVEMMYSRREEGYAYLGAYIDGENAAGTKFSYAQPVIMRYYPNGDKAMQMYLGSRFLTDGSTLPPAAASDALAQLPAPLNPSLRLSVSGGELVAVLKFDGYITPTSAGQYKEQLKAALRADGLQLFEDDEAGFFRCAQYGAVYQLGGRLNEMMLRVKA